MRNFLMQTSCVIMAATLLVAADPAWKSKPAAEWTEEDAEQVLTASPWSKMIKAVITRRLTEEELREAGQMGQPRGLGNDNVDVKGTGPKVSLNPFTGAGGNDRSIRSLNQPIALRLRWENALPVRLAGLKTHEIEPSTSESDGYRIAVYGLPFPDADIRKDLKQLAQPLKNLAALKREGKKDVKPVKVEVFQRENSMVVVYLFPLSAEITRQDGHLQFEAQIGRIVVAQNFDLSEMDFLGKLEL
jgi:hypothetical protein